MLTATVGILGLVALTVALSGCGANADAADCRTNVASVAGSTISRADYRLWLGYTLKFYQSSNPGSKYYGRKICASSKLRTECDAIKKSLLSRMVDQEVIADYATSHNLLPSSSDWSAALRREERVVKTAGGPSAFEAYLSKIGTDQARFRFVESEQLETLKVMQEVGATRFHTWLRHREATVAINRCPVSSL